MIVAVTTFPKTSIHVRNAAMAVVFRFRTERENGDRFVSQPFVGENEVKVKNGTRVEQFARRRWEARENPRILARPFIQPSAPPLGKNTFRHLLREMLPQLDSPVGA